MLRIIALSLFLLGGATNFSFAQSPITAPSTWMNERGSILTIQSVLGDGTFQGTFVNKAPGTYCLDEPYLVEGRAETDKIWFQVAFADRMDSSKNCMTVTQWRGTISATTIDTTWSLAYPGGRLGLIVLGGADKFEKQP